MNYRLILALSLNLVLWAAMLSLAFHPRLDPQRLRMAQLEPPARAR